MKKIKYLIFTINLLFALILTPNALVSKLTPSLSRVQKGQEFNISIVASGLENQLSAADYILNFDSSKVNFVKVTAGQGKPSSDITANVSGSALYISYIDTQNGLSPMNNGTIVTVTFKCLVDNGSTAFSLTGSSYADAGGIDITGTTQNTTVEFYKPNNVALLESLSVDGLSLNPTFNTNTKSYTLADTESSTISINAKASSGATLSGTGTKTLKYGLNTFNIIVTAEDGRTTNTYILKINRIDNRSSNNKLKSLTIEGIDLDFSENQFIYDITIPENITTLNIKAEALDSKTTITGIGLIDIGKDKTSHSIKVTAENGSSSTYLLRFTNREVQTEKSSQLSSLKINNLEIKLNSDYIYLIGVDNSINDLDIQYSTVSPTAQVSISNNTNLTPGINQVSIKVVDEDLASEYLILVNKDPDIPKVNSLNSLNENNIQQDIILEMLDSSNKIIPATILELLKNSQGKLIVNIVNEYHGLLSSFTINNSIDTSNDLNLEIALDVNAPYVITTSLPSDIAVTYYLANINTEGLSIYADTIENQTILLETIPNDNGYISFTTNGAKKYILTNKLDPLSPQTTKAGSKFNVISFLIGFIGGVGVSFLTFLIIKNKDKLFNKATKETTKSIITRQNELSSAKTTKSPTNPPVPDDPNNLVPNGDDLVKTKPKAKATIEIPNISYPSMKETLDEPVELPTEIPEILELDPDPNEVQEQQSTK